MYQMNAGSRDSSRRLDLIHVILGVVVVVMAALAFTDPAENMVLFPLIFFCAALLNLVNAAFLLRTAERDKKNSLRAAAQLFAGALLLALGVVSAVNIW